MTKSPFLVETILPFFKMRLIFDINKRKGKMFISFNEKGRLIVKKDLLDYTAS
jgi:hypothetical protein